MGYEQVFNIRALSPPKISHSKKIARGKKDYECKKIVKDSQFGIKVESTWCNSILEKDKNNPVR
jgi:hypothetical protein